MSERGDQPGEGGEQEQGGAGPPQAAGDSSHTPRQLQVLSLHVSDLHSFAQNLNADTGPRSRFPCNKVLMTFGMYRVHFYIFASFDSTSTREDRIPLSLGEKST